MTSRWALGAVSVLLVEAPGWGWVRTGAERAVVGRGWSLALSPADADALVVCGAPGERLSEVVERVWGQLPGPRARATVVRADEGSLGAALDGVAAVLGDEAHQRDDARQRDQQPGTGGDMDMDMSPDGIALAGGDDDRDGLEMDVLHVPLGPVLPAWPASLVLRCVLAGDVVTHADVEVLDAAGPPPPVDARPRALDAAAALDRVVRLLDLSGPQHLAVAARRVRDLALSTTPPPSGDLDREVERLQRSVARSRLLRWSLRGLGVLDDDALAAHGLPADHRGDVHDRLLAALAAARAALTGEPPALDLGGASTGSGECGADLGGASTGSGECGAGPGGPVAAARAALPALVTGYELAAVRLVVASLVLEEPDGSSAPVSAASGEGERG